MSVYESPKVTRFLNWPGLGPTARVDVAKDKYATNVVKEFLVIIFDEFVDFLLLVSRSFIPLPRISSGPQLCTSFSQKSLPASHVLYSLSSNDSPSNISSTYRHLHQVEVKNPDSHPNVILAKRSVPSGTSWRSFFWRTELTGNMPPVTRGILG